MTTPQETHALTRADRQLLQACIDKDSEALLEALENGASVEAQMPVDADTYAGKRGMHIAAKYGFYDGLRILRDHGADIEAGDGCKGNTPLVMAIAGEDYTSFRMLLDMGADLEHECGGLTPFELCDFGGMDMVGGDFGDTAREFIRLPYEKDITGIDLHALVKHGWLNKKGLLDNPRMLLRIEDIAAELEKHGEFLTTDILLEPGADESSPLQKLCGCGKLAETVEILNRHGEYVQEAALFKADGSPSALLQTAMEWHQAGAFFTRENWRDRSYDELSNALARLPEAAREQIPHINQLRLQFDDTRQCAHAIAAG